MTNKNNGVPEGQEEEEDGEPAQPVSFIESLTQAGLLLTIATGLSTWQNISWSWELPSDAVQTAALCSLLPVAFALAVCVPSYERGTVVRGSSRASGLLERYLTARLGRFVACMRARGFHA